MANKAVELDPLGHVVLDHLEDSDGYPITFVVTGDVEPYAIVHGYQDDGTWDHGNYTFTDKFDVACKLWLELLNKYGVSTTAYQRIMWVDDG